MNDSMQCSVAIGFLEKLISPEQMAKLDKTAISFLFVQEGIKALKNGLITPEHAATIKPSHRLGSILVQLVHDFEANKDLGEPPNKKTRR